MDYESLLVGGMNVVETLRLRVGSPSSTKLDAKDGLVMSRKPLLHACCTAEYSISIKIKSNPLNSAPTNDTLCAAPNANVSNV